MAVPAARGAHDAEGVGDEKGVSDEDFETHAERDDRNRSDDRNRDRNGSDVPCQPSDDESQRMNGFVLNPERYRECTNFRISVSFRRFWTSVGRGPAPCRLQRREFVGYGISYVDDDGMDDGVNDGEYPTALLAVPTLGREDSGLPHEYYIPAQQFRFVSTDGGFVFQTACSDPPASVQHGSFERVI